ncbi:MAG: hypothetical protein RMN52_06235 [Anaerolineae bacterium]|nr:hypothetical protein [Candidatus Roseilinea sp.]MDW8449585.1 hypothetical protein [Anaerolineae bacterium]
MNRTYRTMAALGLAAGLTMTIALNHGQAQVGEGQSEGVVEPKGSAGAPANILSRSRCCWAQVLPLHRPAAATP